jgi:peptide/nickel transport system substrate-binding protein
VIGQKVTLLATSTYGMHQHTAEVVQQNLVAAGLQVELQLPDWGTRVALGNKGQYQFGINGVAPVINDPDGLTEMIGSGPPSYQRSFGYSNEKLDALLAKGRHEVDPAKRKADYEEVASLFGDDVPLCMLTRRSQGYGMKKSLQGFHALPGSDNAYSGYVLEDAYVA